MYNSLRRKKSRLNIRLFAAKCGNDAARVKKLEDEIGLSISTLFNGEKKLVTDSKDLADILQTQFCSVFSDPNCPDKSMPEFALPPIITENRELVLSTELIEEAISEVKLDSAPGPDGIPAILLKRCAGSLSRPIHLLWSESMS